MVSRTKERAHDPLLVPALLALATAVNMLTEERLTRRSVLAVYLDKAR